MVGGGWAGAEVAAGGCVARVLAGRSRRKVVAHGDVLQREVREAKEGGLG